MKRQDVTPSIPQGPEMNYKNVTREQKGSSVFSFFWDLLICSYFLLASPQHPTACRACFGYVRNPLPPPFCRADLPAESCLRPPAPSPRLEMKTSIIQTVMPDFLVKKILIKKQCVALPVCFAVALCRSSSTASDPSPTTRKMCIMQTQKYFIFPLFSVSSILIAHLFQCSSLSFL